LVKKSQFGIIEGAGHGTMHDNKEKNIQLIKDFIASVEQIKK
jgi:proline iminopeptidase